MIQKKLIVSFLGLYMNSMLAQSYDKNDLPNPNVNEQACLETPFKPSVKDIQTKEMVMSILKAMKIEPLVSKIQIRECAGINNCQVQKNSKNQVFLLYDTQFIEKLKNGGFAQKFADTPLETKDWVTIGILAHEIGHLVFRHVDNPIETDDEYHRRELEADELIGVALRRLGATLQNAQSCASMLRKEGSFTHPPREKRLFAIKKGWESENTGAGNTGAQLFRAQKYREAYQALIDLKSKDAESHWYLGQLFEKGLGCVKNKAVAVDHYKVALQKDINYCPAYSALARTDDAALPNEHHTKGALQGCPESQTALGYAFESKSHEKAIFWYSKAVAVGYAAAQHNLAWLYETGQGVPQNLDEAEKLYRSAAKQGYQKSIEKLIQFKK